MSFNEEYNRIKNTVKEDFDFLEDSISNLFDVENPLTEQLSTFLKAPAKRLRPLLGYLFLRTCFNKVSTKQQEVLLATELIHNATLIHDDVIDEADKRRNRETVNKKFDNNLAVIAGDYLLSIAMEKIINIDSKEIFELCASAIKSTCVGEINQYFNKFNIPSINDYIEKSKDKTAYLFKIAIVGGLLASDKEVSKELAQTASNFAMNFGVGFQIRDDLMNILKSGNDFKSGIYTAPIIFAIEENDNLLFEHDILSAIKQTNAIEKSKNLVDNYFNDAISDLQEFQESEHKTALIELINTFKSEI